MSEAVDAIYRATVTSTADPLNKKRVKLKVPQVLGTLVSNWAEPSVPGSSLPKTGAVVWAAFHGGDRNRPIYFAGGNDGGVSQFKTALTAPSAQITGAVSAGSVQTTGPISGSSAHINGPMTASALDTGKITAGSVFVNGLYFANGTSLFEAGRRTVAVANGIGTVNHTLGRAPLGCFLTPIGSTAATGYMLKVVDGSQTNSAFNFLMLDKAGALFVGNADLYYMVA